MYQPIENYAIIGNLRSAVLISEEGSIDWAPAPFIDSPTVFAALLDDEKGGFWSIKPSGNFNVAQRYIENTNVVITEFTTEEGILEVTDFLPIDNDDEELVPEENTTFRIHRKVRCLKGSCEMQMHFEPRFDYARGRDILSKATGGIYVENGDKVGVLTSKTQMNIEEGRATTSRKMEEGETDFFVFRYNVGEIIFYSEDEEHHEAELQHTISFWQNWTHNCDVTKCPAGCRWHETVARSSLVLKILFFEPVGTVAAAATTSLPEDIGGVRNWDYRLTWLRDSSFIFRALFKLGHLKEAEEYINWLINICFKEFREGENVGELNVVYGLKGEREPSESFLTHLSGYKNSRPIRVGNDAYKQRGLDVYGSVFDMIWQLHTLKGGGVIGSREWYALQKMADFVANNWNEPGEGLWEVRGGRRHFVYSKVMCWVALDRALKLADEYNFEGNAELWWNERKAIELEVMSRGWNNEIGSFTQTFDSSNLDAGALLFSVLGFIKGDDPKMLSTIEVIKEKLGCDDGLIKRYTTDDGLPGDEGAFLLASFWMVQALVEGGKNEEAENLFERLISKANHVGLFSEEMDPSTEEFLGNFPQAYTHVGIINSAFALTEAYKQNDQ